MCTPCLLAQAVSGAGGNGNGTATFVVHDDNLYVRFVSATIATTSERVVVEADLKVRPAVPAACAGGGAAADVCGPVM